jgi:hypothetical protein
MNVAWTVVLVCAVFLVGIFIGVIIGTRWQPDNNDDRELP